MDISSLGQEWSRLLAPSTGDVRTELVHEAADFLGIPIAEAWSRLHGAGDRFRNEWLQTVDDRRDPQTLERFYNRSDTELFELIEWHASDAIHFRTLIVRDFFDSYIRPRGCPSYLDYGSGIGNDALVFAHAGFDVTLADISDCLLAFAAWRCRRRGFRVRTVDLKREGLPDDAFNLAICFDVLEHVPDPVDVVRNIREALKTNGLLVVHAPFGDDPEHPMHIVDRDVVTPRMRFLGFRPVECAFPPEVWPPQLYQKRLVPAVDRAGYFIYDNYLNNAIGTRLAAFYRRIFPRRVASACGLR